MTRATNTGKYGEYINEHEVIEGLAEEVLATIRAGDWGQCNSAWARLSETVENHLATEEIDVFPDFPDQALVARLEREHDAIRRGLEALARAIIDERAEPDALMGLIVELRDHGAHEDEVLYPALTRGRT